MIGPINTTISSPKDDPLTSGPPLPPDIPTAAQGKPRKASSMPKTSDENSESAARAAHLLGLSPAMEMARGMMQIEKLVAQLGKQAPAIIQIFAPAIAQARDVAAAAMGNLAQGGLPNSDMGQQGAPPAVGSGLPMAGSSGGVGGMAPMPPPPQ